MSILFSLSNQANGFFGGRGLVSVVAPLYLMLQQQFVARLNNNSALNERLSLWEWERGTSVFHAKGVWLYSKLQPNTPFATYVGSSNFGQRSVDRDVEAQMLIVSTDPQLQMSMKHVSTKENGKSFQAIFFSNN
jgi:CDP-diacylglycerol--glycerol-3-phosphate 3-phosphatidyltransferase